MKFYKQTTRYGNYGGCTHIKRPINREKALIELRQSPDHNITVSTWVYNTRKIFITGHYILAIDCDSQDHYLAAKNYIAKFLKFETYDIESSPGHYWIICDCVDSMKRIWPIANEIPGVCAKYLEMCKKHKMFLLRAFPKNGGVPQFSKTHMHNSMISSWIYEFASYFESKGMQDVLYANALREAVKNGEVSHFAANPSFMVETAT